MDTYKEQYIVCFTNFQDVSIKSKKTLKKSRKNIDK